VRVTVLGDLGVFPRACRGDEGRRCVVTDFGPSARCSPTSNAGDGNRWFELSVPGDAGSVKKASKDDDSCFDKSARAAQPLSSLHFPGSP
jgi:hypothetical protein